jgi:hypothetical protein
MNYQVRKCRGFRASNDVLIEFKTLETAAHYCKKLNQLAGKYNYCVTNSVGTVLEIMHN